MELSNDILLAVFDEFLKNPRAFFKFDFMSEPTIQQTDINQYYPKQLSDSPELIRWHVMIFLSEFVIDRAFIRAFSAQSATFSGTDFLNRSGQLLYSELKNRPQNK